MFSCEYCEILKNTYFEEYLWTATSGLMGKVLCRERLRLLIIRHEVRPWGKWNFSMKTKKWSYFITGVFSVTNSFNAGISFELNEIIQYCWTFFLLLNLFSSRYAICWFYILIFFWEVLKFWMNFSSFCVCHNCYHYSVL